MKNILIAATISALFCLSLPSDRFKRYGLSYMHQCKNYTYTKAFYCLQTCLMLKFDYMSLDHECTCTCHKLLFPDGRVIPKEKTTVNFTVPTTRSPPNYDVGCSEVASHTYVCDYNRHIVMCNVTVVNETRRMGDFESRPQMSPLTFMCWHTKAHERSNRPLLRALGSEVETTCSVGIHDSVFCTAKGMGRTIPWYSNDCLCRLAVEIQTGATTSQAPPPPPPP